MFRLLGFLVGCVASIGIIVWLLGMPRLGPDSAPPRKSVVEEETRDDRPPETPAAESAPGEHAQPATGTVNAAEPAVPGGDPAIAGGPQEAPPAAALHDAPTERHWHAFWTPFRSRIAARGFVTRLERVTGLDYRIVKVNDVYEVSFAYESDAELDRKLSQIHAATGLDLQAE